MSETVYRNDNLGAWQNAPVIQDEVISYIDKLGGSFILRDVYRPLGLPRRTVNRVLLRLHAKGVLTRRKVPIELPCPARRPGSASPHTARRMCYLYSYAGGFAR
ncbi:hypothetical protein GCM10010990_04900 [Croceicoccus mobilis]|uniref:HTH iclR-type domain-containing protein n=1 Tax=Croceicoccus mobilis TaxID=1703339 RepID=A0A917DPI3_9SPHN|nr:hypothetical protein GCM10010990_04900 [Croceicoccus mobilis]